MGVMGLSTVYIAGNFRAVKNSFIWKTVVFVSKIVSLPALAFIRSGKATPTLKFRGGQLAHKNNEFFTPRKLPAIR